MPKNVLGGFIIKHSIFLDPVYVIIIIIKDLYIALYKINYSKALYIHATIKLLLKY